MTSPKPVNGVRRRPSRDILSGESADVYFSRAEEILSKENIDPVVVMEVFARQDVARGAPPDAVDGLGRCHLWSPV